MKNIFTLVLTFCLTGLLTAQVERMVLLEEYTNASCPPCASQNPAFNQLIEQNRDKVIAIKWQTPFPGFDPMNQHNADDVEAHFRRYATVYPDFGGVPTSFVDGELPGFDYANGAGNWGTPQTGYRGGPYGYNQAVIDFAASQDAPVSISLDHNLFAQNDSIEVNMQVVNMSNETISGDLKAHIVLMEREIVFPCGPPGSTNEEDFYDVARRKLTGLTGMSVEDMAPGDTLNINMSYAVPGYIYQEDEIYVTAFLQDWTTLEVFNAATDAPKPLDYFKDVSLGNRETSNDALCDDSYVPAAIVNNLGLDTVQEMTIEYQFNGSSADKTFTNMNLAPGEAYVAEFGQVTHPGGGVPISYTILDIDGELTDGNEFNDVGCEPFLSKKASTPVFLEVEEDFEDNQLGVGPSNFNRNGEYRQAFIVVDQEILGGAGSAGYKSRNGVLVDFYNWPTNQLAQEAEMLYLFRQDFSNITNAMMTFNYFKAFRATNPRYSDSLLIQASFDCGENWQTIWSISGEAWSTVEDSDDFATPGRSSNWKDVEVSLESLQGQPDVTLKFVAVNGGGNTLMLDQIELSGVVSSQNAIANQIKLWPNPARMETVHLSLPQDLQVDGLRVFDLTGKLIDQQSSSSERVGRLTWMPRHAGAFIMELQTNKGSISKQIMVVE